MRMSGQLEEGRWSEGLSPCNEGKKAMNNLASNKYIMDCVCDGDALFA